MKFLKLLLFFAFPFLFQLNFAFAFRSNPVSLNDGVKIFLSSYGLKSSSGKFMLGGCDIQYEVSARSETLSIRVATTGIDKRIPFEHIFYFGRNQSYGEYLATQLLWKGPSVIGLVSEAESGYDCETQGCIRYELIRVIVKSQLLLVQHAGPYLFPRRYSNTETILECRK